MPVLADSLLPCSHLKGRMFEAIGKPELLKLLKVFTELSVLLLSFSAERAYTTLYILQQLSSKYGYQGTTG